jgi:hypothetical protein
MSGRFEDRLKELQSLPELEPRVELEPVVLAAMQGAALGLERRPRYLAKAAMLAAATGIAALLALWAVSYEDPDGLRQAAALEDEAYFELVEASAQLDALLAVLPPPRRVMRAGTASTIVGLEDRIALIDAELYRSQAEATPPGYRNALMRDRVEVMNALVNVRYAQSRAFVY